MAQRTRRLSILKPQHCPPCAHLGPRNSVNSEPSSLCPCALASARFNKDTRTPRARAPVAAGGNPAWGRRGASPGMQGPVRLRRDKTVSWWQIAARICGPVAFVKTPHVPPSRPDGPRAPADQTAPAHAIPPDATPAPRPWKSSAPASACLPTSSLERGRTPLRIRNGIPRGRLRRHACVPPSAAGLLHSPSTDSLLARSRKHSEYKIMCVRAHVAALHRATGLHVRRLTLVVCHTLCCCICALLACQRCCALGSALPCFQRLLLPPARLQPAHAAEVPHMQGLWCVPLPPVWPRGPAPS